jgi:protocatechuate 4,5-dioxygenase beta chain
MARIIGGIGTSHVPAIGQAIAKGLGEDPYWKPYFSGYAPVREWLEEVEPDVAIIIYNDHGLNFFLDALPTFAIGAAPEYKNADEGWGLRVSPPFPGDPALSWHLIEALVAAEFDPTVCQEMLVDHAFVIPTQLLWPAGLPAGLRTIPVAINTVQHPLPTPARCFKLGQAIGHAVESYGEDLDVVVLGTGGLSHQLDGQRAGFINKEFDRLCMERIVDDPQALTHYSVHELVELAGTQGVEILNWIAMRGCLTGSVSELHRHYHIPISNTAAAVQLLKNEPLLIPERRGAALSLAGG